MCSRKQGGGTEQACPVDTEERIVQDIFCFAQEDRITEGRMPLLKSSPPGSFLPTPLELVVVDVLELITANSPFKSSHLDANVSALVLAAKKIIVPFTPLQPFSL